jgi:hypothetical protein
MSDSRRIDTVNPGFYRVKLVRGGPFIAARIVITDDMIEVSHHGHPAHFRLPVPAYFDLVVEQTTLGQADKHPLTRVSWFGQRISEGEYRYLIHMHEWAKAHAPDHPMADPTKPIHVAGIAVRRLF